MKSIMPCKMFWMVWNEQRGIPKAKHDTLQAAKQEAVRISQLHPGETCHILALVTSCAHSSVIWATPHGDDDDIDF